MAGAADQSVRDFSNQRLRVRDDLSFRYQSLGGERCYVVEDPLKSRFYRIGIPEYQFIRLLDGSRTVGQCLGQMARTAGSEALTLAEATTVCRWLLDASLAVGTGDAQGDALYQERQRSRSRSVRQRFLNLIFVRIPLVNPDAWLARVVARVRWFPPWIATIAWIAVTLAGGLQLFAHWDRFAASAADILVPNNWFWLLAMWVGLKLVHEFAHGFVCKWYGGDVLEFGIILIVFAPLGYTDATSSWRLPTRWQRLHVALAGILAELFLASIALWVWAGTPPGLLNQAAYNTVIAAAVTTLLFNLNPLMRFDGYYVLSDLVDVPNLYAQGAQYVRYVFRRCVLGAQATFSYAGRHRAGLVKVYGVAAFLWRILIVAGILLMASMLFMGAGVVIAAMAIILWFVPPVFRFFRDWWKGDLAGEIRPVRGIIVPLAVVAGLLVVSRAAIWPGGVGAPGYVEYGDLATVRSQVAGFVESVSVRDGERVEAGQLLMRLHNDELRAEKTRLELDLEQTLIRARRYQQAGEMASYQVEEQNARATRSRLQEKSDQVAALDVRAPRAGLVLSRQLENLEGRWMSVGRPLLSIADEHNKRIRISVAQADGHVFRRHVGRPVPVRIRGQLGYRRYVLREIEPQADLRTPSELLVATSGGPLPVRPTAIDGSPSGGGEMLFLDPRFSGIVELGDRGDEVRAGQLAHVRFLTVHRSVADRLGGGFLRWFRRVSERARARWLGRSS